MNDDNARASFSDDEDERDDGDVQWNPPVCTAKDECHKGDSMCCGYCMFCHQHNAYNGGQCICF